MDSDQLEYNMNMEHFYEQLDGFSSYIEQGELLNILLNNLEINNKLTIAEIGVYKGRGTSMWNVELINKNIDYDYYAIDHFLGSAEHDKNVNYYEITKQNLRPIIDKINLIKNDSISESKNYVDGFFDVIYIDASHEYEYVKEDILTWLPKVKKGGIICGDDYIGGWPGVIQAVNELFGNKVNVVGGQQWWVKN
jgi:predicted O-methyltransferase YrrM